jgi:hypothetical protein
MKIPLIAISLSSLIHAQETSVLLDELARVPGIRRRYHRFHSIGGNKCLRKRGADSIHDKTFFKPGAHLFSDTNYTKHSPTEEKPHGQWNTVEIYTLGQTSVFLINGTPGIVIFNARRQAPGSSEEVPLTIGKIQHQSEAA